MNLTKSEYLQICRIAQIEFKRTPGWSWWEYRQDKWTTDLIPVYDHTALKKSNCYYLLSFRVKDCGLNFVSKTKRFSATILELLPETSNQYACLRLKPF